METMFSNGMCRCCASEGTFKDLSTKYRWMGVDEVYSDMLQECFNVTLSTPEDSPEGGICEVCITQLRNAANFRKQVLNTEEQFKRMIQNKAFKSNIVKVEVNAPDDELPLTDEDNNLSNDDFSSTEYDLPIKTESSEEGKSRKRSAKAGPSRSKQPKLEGESSTKRLAIETHQKDKTNKALQAIEDEIEKIDVLEKIEDKTEKANIGFAVAVLQSSTLLPFKTSPEYSCVYCDCTYPDLDELEDHASMEHRVLDTEEICNAIAYAAKQTSFIAVNVVNLECKMCDDIIRDDLYDLQDHLLQNHSIELPDIEDPLLVPFKIANGVCECALCGKIFKGFRFLSCHMNEHFPNHKCDVCGAGFLTPERLGNHQHNLSHYKHNETDSKRNESPKLLQGKAPNEQNAGKDVIRTMEPSQKEEIMTNDVDVTVDPEEEDTKEITIKTRKSETARVKNAARVVKNSIVRQKRIKTIDLTNTDDFD